MERVDICAGPLFWFDVSDGNGGDHPVALVECGCCGDIFTTTHQPDARHLDTLVVRA